MQLQGSHRGYFGPARVIEIDQESGRVLVEPEGAVHAEPSWATIATPGYSEFVEHDEVLVTGEEADQWYVIGVIGKPQRVPRIDIDQGSYAEVSATPAGNSVQVFSAADDLLFEFQPALNRIKLYTDAPNLEVENRTGDLSLRTAGRMRLQAQSIEMDSRYRIEMGLAHAPGTKQARVSLERNQVSLEGEKACINATRGDFRFAELKYTGKRFIGKLAHASITAFRLETTARTMICKARNAYQKVEQLAQLSAGRVRTLVKATYHVKAENTIMKADKDYKVNADKIHLG